MLNASTTNCICTCLGHFGNHLASHTSRMHTVDDGVSGVRSYWKVWISRDTLLATTCTGVPLSQLVDLFRSCPLPSSGMSSYSCSSTLSFVLDFGCLYGTCFLQWCSSIFTYQLTINCTMAVEWTRISLFSIRCQACLLVALALRVGSTRTRIKATSGWAFWKGSSDVSSTLSVCNSLFLLSLSLPTCCYDLTKGTQDKGFSYSFSILSLPAGHSEASCFA